MRTDQTLSPFQQLQAAAKAAGHDLQIESGFRTYEEQRALRTHIEERYDVVPLSNGIALRPKTPRGDVRLIEIADTIAINGTQVSGRELRDRLVSGEGARVILFGAFPGHAVTGRAVLAVDLLS